MKKATTYNDSNTLALMSLFGLGLIIFSIIKIGKTGSFPDTGKTASLGVRG